jgi:hypothetical protein
MSKVKLDWFKLENYEPSKNFSAEEWAVEIELRLMMQFFSNFIKGVSSEEIKKRFIFKSFFASFNRLTSYEEKDLYEYATVIKEHIRKFGLINNNLPQKNLLSIVEKSSRENQYVRNISTTEAFGFLYDSDRKDEYSHDMAIYESLPVYVDKPKSNEIIHSKYAHAISDELLDMYSRTVKLKGSDNVFRYKTDGDRFLNVNLYASDEIIKMEFERWLQVERIKSGIEIKEKNFKSTDFNDWSKNQILACWDIVTISKLEGIEIENEAIGRLIFPNEYDVSLAERVRKVIKPKAKRVINSWVVDALLAQTEAE